MKRIKEIFGKFPVPAMPVAMFTVLYCEILMHLWITDELQLGRFTAVLAFALGFGGLLGQVVSFIGHKKWGKWVTFALLFLVSAFYIVEYFVAVSYQSFMTVSTLLSGAKGVATDFADVVLTLVLNDFWRILVIILPSVAYAFFAAPASTSWRSRWFGLAIALAAYIGGYGIVQTVGVDADRMGRTYNFDSAIRVFGLNMGMTLDVLNSGSAGETQGDFVIVETPAAVTPKETVPEETVPEEIVYEPNIVDFDFTALAEAETYNRVAAIHRYVNTVQPTMKNEMTGLFAGKNLIIITAEAFAKEVIDPELTPTLYRLANEGIRFDDYYQPMWGGSTSSGEFSVLTGLVSASGTNSIKESRQQELFLSISKQLQKQGYHTAAYHNHLYKFYDRHTTHTYYGYDTFMGMGNGMEEGVKEQWPESDLEMMEFTVDHYIDKQPFSIYYMTVSGHCRYNLMGGNKMSSKNKEKVQDLPYSNTVKAYIACNLELEAAMAHLVGELEKAGIADDTVIVLTTDHYPYGLEPGSTWDNAKDYVAELYGYNPKNNIERDHSALILWSGCLEDMDLAITTPTYSLDILPTLSNLFGVEYDSRLLVGRDVFSDAEPIVLWYDYTWVTDKGRYDSAKGKFYPNEGETVDEAYVDRIADIVYNKIFYSREVQNIDYFNYLVEAKPELVYVPETEPATEPAVATTVETTAETTPPAATQPAA